MKEEVLKRLDHYSMGNLIEKNQSMYFSGSCFSAEIGARCIADGFSALANPGGTMFDPLSIERHLEGIMTRRKFSSIDLFFHDGVYRNWDHYSRLGTSDEKETLHKLNHLYESAATYLSNCRVLWITFGTAWYYQLNANHRPVCNCHKMPNSLFEKRIMSSAEIVERWTIFIQRLRAYNPSLNIGFTVSPVKHLRDGLIENSRSKAILLDAVHQLAEKSLGHYFPAYELVNDVLRDYSYYKDDNAHPNEKAIDFVYRFFKEKVLAGDR
jgi:hypothetical protein